MFHINVNVTKFQVFRKFIQLCYKSRFAFNVCYIKRVENIGPDEIHSIRETYRGVMVVLKNYEGFYLDFHLIYFTIICSI